MPLTLTVETPRRLPYRGLMADAASGDGLDFAMPPEKATRFPRTARLLRHADFERVYKEGRRHFSATMTVFYWPRPAARSDAGGGQDRAAIPGLRVGFTVGRALGGAVQRNRIKRRLREAVRLSPPVHGVAADVVINPKKAVLTAEFAALRDEVSHAFAVIEKKLAGTPQKAFPESRKPETGSRC